MFHEVFVIGCVALHFNPAFGFTVKYLRRPRFSVWRIIKKIFRRRKCFKSNSNVSPERSCYSNLWFMNRFGLWHNAASHEIRKIIGGMWELRSAMKNMKRKSSSRAGEAGRKTSRDWHATEVHKSSSFSLWRAKNVGTMETADFLLILTMAFHSWKFSRLEAEDDSSSTFNCRLASCSTAKC